MKNAAAVVESNYIGQIPADGIVLSNTNIARPPQRYGLSYTCSILMLRAALRHDEVPH